MSIIPASQVGINAHLLSQQAGYRSAGVHGYIFNLLRCLPAVSENNNLTYRIFVGEGQIADTDGVAIARSSWPTGNPVVRILWEQLALPRQRLDLLHSMAFVSPLVSRWPTIVTVYDLSFLHYPDAFTAGRRAYLRLLGKLSCRRARRVIAISDSTRRDLVMQWGLSPAKIDVAYPGVGDQFRPLPATDVESFRKAKALPERFILHLGTLQPRKNLARLIQAFGQLNPEQLGIKLVLAGGKGWLYQEILAEIERLNLKDHIILTGFVPAMELAYWYNAASVLAYPSLYEGFGMPVVEAMACNTPVVTSNVSSMPEAAGGRDSTAALLIDPHDTNALAEALFQVLTDDHLRNSLQVEGRAQAARFTWQQTAAATVQSYQLALGHRL